VTSRGDKFTRDVLEAVPPEARRGVEGVFRRWAGTSLYLARAERYRRAEVAALLQQAGLSNAEAVAALSARFDISRSAARRFLRKLRDPAGRVAASDL
jgi:hypothetical protein